MYDEANGALIELNPKGIDFKNFQKSKHKQKRNGSIENV